MHDGTAIAIENAAQVVERTTHIDVGNIDVPMLMRMRWLFETSPLARRLALPRRQQSGSLQYSPKARRTYGHNVRIQHHERQPPVPFQRILQMETDDRFFLPRLQPLITLRVVGDLGADLELQSRYAEAEKLLRDAVGVDRRVLGPEHQVTLATTNNLAACIYSQGRYAEAEKLLRQMLETERRVLGPNHITTLSLMDNLALALRQENRYPEAEALERETLDADRRVLGPEHPLTLLATETLALILKREGNYAEAEKLIRQVLDVQRRVLGPSHWQTAESIYNIGCKAAMQGNRNKALLLVRDAVDHGFMSHYDATVIEQDTDLTLLHGDPRFPALLAHARQVAAAAPKPN